MVSSSRPLFADTFMVNVEHLAEDLIENMSPYKRYVDDLLVIYERKKDDDD